MGNGVKKGGRGGPPPLIKMCLFTLQFGVNPKVTTCDLSTWSRDCYESSLHNSIINIMALDP